VDTVLVDYANVNGIPARQEPRVNFGPDASVPAIINDGSENVADIDASGNLDFYWQDSSGQFHMEAVDTSGTL
jgi:hypothetical protein